MSDMCEYCGKRPAYKTDGKAKGICSHCLGLTHDPRRVQPVPGRNEKCPCGSGKKYKHCHIGDPNVEIVKVEK